MFGHLKYEVEFTSGIRPGLANEVDFEKGFTCITGPNESGKSMILEMLRYGLFGTEALRGATKDYKKINDDVTFSVRGKTYRVVRTLRDATLYEGEEPVAKGTKPVNARIIEIFGYGLKVFDTAHSCNQGEIERLGDMKATERRQMVDNVIGLNVIDGLSKWLADTALDHMRQADAMEDQLIVPEKPEVPQGLRPIEEIDTELVSVTEQLARRNELVGWLSQTRTAPTEPTAPVISETIEVLQKEQSRLETKQALQRKLSGYQQSSFTTEQLDEIQGQHEAYAAYQESQARGPRPKLTLDEIKVHEDALDVYARWQAHKRMKDQGDITCPCCGEDFAVVEEIRGLHIPDTMDKPIYDQQTLNTERRRNAAWENFTGDEPPPATKPTLSIAQIGVERSKLTLVNERQDIERQILALGDPRDTTASIKALRTYEMGLEAYKVASKDYLSYLEERKSKEALLATLADVAHDHQRLVSERDTAMQFAHQLKTYEQQRATYEAMIVRIDAEREKENHYRAASKAVKELRSRVKEYLVPSLNRVSSHLLRVMTGGKRSSLLIDEDFNITVDSQPLNTLSGSGKSVANLAIRLGLGQVLTNRVFPVFMGDEIDAAMDADRAGNTAECFKNLTDNIAQVMLVSHKTLEANHFIELSDGEREEDS